MRKFLLLVMAMSVAVVNYAAITSHKALKAPIAQKVLFQKTDKESLRQPVKTMTYEAPARMPKTPVSTYNVSIDLLYDEEIYKPSIITFINEDVTQYGYPRSHGYNITVPAGKYIVGTKFILITEDGWGNYGDAYVIYEDVEIGEDFPNEISIDASDASITIECNPVDPNGENFSLEQYDYDNWSPESGIPVIPGTMTYVGIIDYIYHSEYGVVFGSGRGSNYQEETQNIFKQSWFRTNPLSDKLTLLQVAIGSNDEGYCITEMTPITGPQISEEAQYGSYNRKFEIPEIHTENYDLIDSTVKEDMPFATTLTVNLVLEDGDKFFMPISVTSKANTIQFSGVDENIGYQYLLLTPGVVDYFEYYYDPEYSETDPAGYVYYPNELPEVILLENNELYNAIDAPLSDLTFTGEYIDDYEIPNTLFSFYEKQMEGTYGDSQPILTLTWTKAFESVFDWDTFEYYYDPYYTVLGSVPDRMGANMTGNFANSSFTLEGDLADKWDDPNRTEKGDFELTMNISHQKVEGIQAFTDFYAYWDENQADQCPPVLTMMQFRNGEIVTDRFENADEGTILLCGGDFNFEVLNEDTYPEVIWTPGEASMEIAWRPTGSDNDWEPLDLAIDTEAGYYPGMGYTWSGSLASVNAKSATGWFDVQVIMKDEAGNNMSQIISSAFKISELSGIEDVESNGDVVSSTYVDLLGRPASANTEGMLIRTDRLSDGSTRTVKVINR